jgi:hypothetical protein
MSGRLLLCQIAIASLLTASAKAPASPLSHASKGKKSVVETPSKKSAKSAHGAARPEKPNKNDKNAKNAKNSKKHTSERRAAQGHHERHTKEVASRSRRGKFGKEVERESAPPAVSEPVRTAQAIPVVPDRILVIESASSNPLPSTPTPVPAAMTVKPMTPAILTPIRKIDVDIPTNRVIEIQQALSKRGFYVGDPSGVYDDATIDAMRRFQASNEIGITGYPTAPALKRLGLTNW